MLYVIYNPETDIDEFKTTSITSALMRAGEMLDDFTDPRHFVAIYDMTEDDYIDSFTTSTDAVETYTLKGFVKHFGVPEVPDAGLEVYHNLDQNEQLEVLKFIPDIMLIDELKRRTEEYRKYADAIREAGDALKIYV